MHRCFLVSMLLGVLYHRTVTKKAASYSALPSNGKCISWTWSLIIGKRSVDRCPKQNVLTLSVLTKVKTFCSS